MLDKHITTKTAVTREASQIPCLDIYYDAAARRQHNRLHLLAALYHLIVSSSENNAEQCRRLRKLVNRAKSTYVCDLVSDTFLPTLLWRSLNEIYNSVMDILPQV